MAYDRYDLSGSRYTETQNEKERQYRSMITRAEMTRMEKGKPSKEEAQYYLTAAAICDEVRSMNLSQPEVNKKWGQLKAMCEQNVRDITYALNPSAFAQAAQAPAAPNLASTKPPVTQKTALAAKPAAAPAAKAAAPAAKTAEKPEAGYEVTPSGFKTRNACKDVAATTIEKWYKPRPNHSLDDVTGMEKQKELLRDEIRYMGWDRLDEVLKINSVQGYMFYGLPGCGKTYLIEAFANEVMGNASFRYIKLIGSEIKASLVGVAEKTVQIAAQEAMDNMPCVLFIDEFDNVCVDRNSEQARGNEKSLTNAFLEAWNTMHEYGKNIIFIGATNYPNLIDPAMMDRVTMVKVDLPSEEERLRYFQKEFSTMGLEDGFTYDEIVSATENYNYRDMERLAKPLKLDIKSIALPEIKGDLSPEEKSALDEAASKAVLEGDMPLTRERFFNRRNTIIPSDKSKILETLNKFEAGLSIPRD